MPIPLLGDRSAYDVNGFPLLHANDFEVGDSHHPAVSLTVGSSELLYMSGQILTLREQEPRRVLIGPNAAPAAAPTFRELYLDTLADVVVTAPAPNEVLVFSSGVGPWINQQLAASAVYITDTYGYFGGTLDNVQEALEHIQVSGNTIDYTPAVVADWDGSEDPGNIVDALDQLAARVTNFEVTGGGDATAVTYTPNTLTDWDSDTDPGNVDGALDQLASRLKDAEETLNDALRTRTLNFIINGGGDTIATGIAGDMVVDFACTITAWTILADQAGTIKIDVWRDTYANFPPTDADSICNGHEPEISSSATKAQDTNLSDWSDVTLDAGDILRFNVDSIDAIERVTLALKATTG